ncbi:MarR family winged helix-turn-helix transcriptional regulator [Deinococcus misasensis]|uniref:MarR family winged helix-turn-helix transcriptional regulator n=1 Tax=Deinococcus misasensis TaxID=392413 RepID=UPI00055305C4|nr:MarR family winged helix-turn-helix transcriptional regulator [Deinococcus misasensis]
MQEDPPSREDCIQFMHAWRHFFHSMKRGMLRDIEQELNIDASDMPLLQALQQGCQYPSEVSQSYGMAPPMVSQMIVRTVKQGLVGRELDPEDSRRIRLNLTDQGKSVVDHAHRYLEARFLNSGLTAAELKHLTQGLIKLGEALKEEA